MSDSDQPAGVRLQDWSNTPRACVAAGASDQSISGANCLAIAGESCSDRRAVGEAVESVNAPSHARADALAAGVGDVVAAEVGVLAGLARYSEHAASRPPPRRP